MITLWGRNNSTNVKKVRLILEELELPYTQILAGLQFGLNHDPEYLAMNPNGLVPLLRDDETNSVLWESNTIVRFLAAQYGQGRLWIDEPAARAQAEKWMDWASTTLAPEHSVILKNLIRTPPEQRNQAAVDAAIVNCDKLLGLLDESLGSAPWFSGDEFGLGDIAMAPFIYSLFTIHSAWTERPNLARWYAQLTARPTVKNVVMIPVT
ncbi:glutathione S-transferase family protein [Enterobacter sp.]|uniref:glutathione S-transferase family protein n=1 Tax=Enterobacter sp. TaxID=42895 RepID=UPI00296F51F0|nr:glutathione S-transferase family protein [Enterobacter sp.]